MSRNVHISFCGAMHIFLPAIIPIQTCHYHSRNGFLFIQRAFETNMTLHGAVIPVDPYTSVLTHLLNFLTADQ